MTIEGNPAEYYDDEEDWHVSRGQNRSGPFRFSDLVAGIDQQLIKATDFVWRRKWTEWRQVKSVPGLASLTSLSESEQQKPAIPISDLVEHVDIKPRSKSRP